MRTTLNLDDDVFESARTISRAERRPLGAVVSDLMRRGLAAHNLRIDEQGFPVFRVPPGTAPITDEVVQAASVDA